MQWCYWSRPEVEIDHLQEEARARVVLWICQSLISLLEMFLSPLQECGRVKELDTGIEMSDSTCLDLAIAKPNTIIKTSNMQKETAWSTHCGD